jgi:hypothetical protein
MQTGRRDGRFVRASRVLTADELAGFSTAQARWQRQHATIVPVGTGVALIGDASLPRSALVMQQ